MLLERCQKYVHHLDNKVKQSLAEHQKKKLLDEDVSTSTKDEDDMKRTGLLNKYYEMSSNDIQKRQTKLFVGALKPCNDEEFSMNECFQFFCIFRSIGWFRMASNSS